MPARVVTIWNHAKVNQIVYFAPRVAHAAAAQAAANAAAERIGGSGSGALAADVRTPKMGAFGSGAQMAEVGSDLPYAAIEHYGGLIVAKDEDGFLYIRPGNITARVQSVVHKGKRYLDYAPPVYIATLLATLKANFPR